MDTFLAAAGAPLQPRMLAAPPPARLMTAARNGTANPAAARSAKFSPNLTALNAAPTGSLPASLAAARGAITGVVIAGASKPDRLKPFFSGAAFGAPSVTPASIGGSYTADGASLGGTSAGPVVAGAPGVGMGGVASGLASGITTGRNDCCCCKPCGPKNTPTLSRPVISQGYTPTSQPFPQNVPTKSQPYQKLYEIPVGPTMTQDGFMT